MVDRQIPDVWNIFDISSAQRDQDILNKWCDRSSVCDRPRTYDKFYQRLPWAYVSPTAAASPTLSSTDLNKEIQDERSPSCERPKKAKKKKKALNYSRTVTERDVKHIERHLSMKKTIRKKIMRDLQQAFVPDPDELAKNNEIKMESALQFDPKRASTAPDKSDKLLDLLRDSSSDDSGVVNDDELDGKCRRLKTPRERASSSRLSLEGNSDEDCSTDDNVSREQEPEPKKEKTSWWEMLLGKKKSTKA